MAESTKMLVMQFTTAYGKKRTVKITDPKENLTAQQVADFMNLLNDKRFFTTINPGGAPAVLEGAKVVETVTDTLDIEVG